MSAIGKAAFMSDIKAASPPLSVGADPNALLNASLYEEALLVMSLF